MTDSKINLLSSHNNNITNKINENQNTINNPNAMFNTNSNFKNNTNLPCVTDNKKIYIHKPSDFIKNKYTFLGSLANNSEILSLKNKRNYHSPRFSMKDIKLQIIRENRIIGSILKDEVDSLPNLLKNCIPNLNKNKTENYFGTNSMEKFNIASPNSFNNFLINKFKNKINFNVSSNDNVDPNIGSKFINSCKELRGFNPNIDQGASNKVNRLINLNFLIPSPKKKNANFPSGNSGNTERMSFNKFNSINSYNYNSVSNMNSTKASNFLAKSQSMKYNPVSMDNSSINGNSNENINLFIKSKKNNSFKDYLIAKNQSIDSSKGNLFLSLI